MFSRKPGHLVSGLPTQGVELRKDTASSVDGSFDTIQIALLVAILYYAGTKVGFFFKPVGVPISIFWPPNALLLAAFLMTPKRLWWAILAAVLPAHLLAQLPAGVPVAR